MELNEYLSEMPGRQVEMAKAIGMSGSFLSQIARGARAAPAAFAPAIQELSGYRVRVWDLRPKDWHRIWPELVGQAGAPSVEATNAD